MSVGIAAQPVVALEGVSKRFGQQLAVAETSLAIEPGAFFSIVGESGCGKTTLLRLVAGLEQPSSGQVVVNGQMVTGPRTGVGIAFQTPALLSWRSALENVLLPVEAAGERVSPETRQRALSLMARAGLAEAVDKRPHELSGGMQSRVALARALLREPSLLLLDEPFAALDVLTRERMGLALLDLWSDSNATAIFVTHDIAEAVFLSDRVAVMGSRPGRLRQTFDVPLSRPRALETRYDPAFIDLCRQVRLAMEEAESIGGGIA